MFDNVKTAVTEYQHTLNELKTKLQKEFIEKLKVDCNDIKAKYPNLDHIFILGETPEWNDGEECTHSSEVFLVNSAKKRWDTVQDYLERLYWGDEDQYPEEFKNSNKNLSTSDIQEIEDSIRASRLEDGFEVVYDTNFNIVIDFTGNEVEVSVQEYDCGH